jgi:uncharacterized membrane protein YcaP (DUF421 family)
MDAVIGHTDWGALFVPDTPVLEILVRGSLMYFAMFLLLRFVQKRGASSLSTTDLLVIVLLADAAQNGMAGDYTSIADGALLVTVIVLWSVGLNWLGYHSRRIGALIHPVSLVVIQDGVVVEEHLRRELITHEELMTGLREQGMRRVEEVQEARIEGNGRLTAFGRDSHPDDQAQDVN